MKPYSLDLREKIVESVKKGVPKLETARRFGVDRATVKRYCKQLDECGTLQPRKAPGKRLKLDEKAKKLLVVGVRRVRLFLRLEESLQMGLHSPPRGSRESTAAFACTLVESKNSSLPLTSPASMHSSTIRSKKPLKTS